MPITAVQQTYIDGLTRFVTGDARIRAAWLEGSFATGRADRYSDVDAHLLAEPTELAAFQNADSSPFEVIRPTVLANFLFGSMWNLITVDGLRVDVWVHGDEMHSVAGKAVTVLYDESGGALMGIGETRDSFDPDFAAILERAIPEFWRMMSMLPTVIGRRELVVSNIGLALEANLLGDVLIVGEGIVRDRGIKNLNDYLPDDILTQLERAMEVGALTQESLAAAHLRLARIMMQRGRIIAEQRDYDYPDALEQTVVRYVSDELTRLRLEAPLKLIEAKSV